VLFTQILWLSSLSILLFFGDSQSQNTWSKKFTGIGTFSSPRVSDLNGDGVGDIILGAGREEFQSCDSAVIALDGQTGMLLWNVSAKDQVFGSASLKDITSDRIMDIFINGRSEELIAINGRSGEVIWRFKVLETEKDEWFNFYNPQFIPDQNNDGLEDMLISNGGDVLAEPYDPYRPPGQLVVIDSKTGELLGKAAVPDGNETYMSVAILPDVPSNVKSIIFGTGGETIGGNLFVASIDDVM